MSLFGSFPGLKTRPSRRVNDKSSPKEFVNLDSVRFDRAGRLCSVQQINFVTGGLNMPHRLKQFFVCAAAIAALAASPLTLLSQEVIMQKAISLDLAHAIAQAALDDCRSHNYHPAIVVIDASGAIKVLLRDDGSGPQNADTARRKAFTALTFKGNPSDQVKIWETQKIPNIGPDRVALAGGVAIKSGNDVIGAIGIGGAPGSEKDEACALAGVAKYANKLK
jgi:uncharacterized protein GlcG (DUF336 family)